MLYFFSEHFGVYYWQQSVGQLSFKSFMTNFRVFIFKLSFCLLINILMSLFYTIAFAECDFKFWVSEKIELELEINSNKVFPYIKSSDGNVKYFACEESRSKYYPTNLSKQGSLQFFVNNEIKQGSDAFMVEGYLKMHDDQLFENLKIRSGDLKWQIQRGEKGGSLFLFLVLEDTELKVDSYFAMVQPIAKVESVIKNLEAGENKETICGRFQDELDYSPSYSLILDQGKFRNLDSKNEIKKTIKEFISTQNPDLLDSKLMYSQKKPNERKDERIVRIECFYLKLLKDEDLNRKNQILRYMEMNKNLLKALIVFNSNQAKVSKIIQKLRGEKGKVKISAENISSYEADINSHEEASKSEDQIYNSDIEAHSVYGVFALDTKKLASETTNELYKDMFNIFSGIALESLSGVYLESETTVRDGFVIEDKIIEQISGIVNEASTDAFLTEYSNRAFSVKKIKYMPLFNKSYTDISLVSNSRDYQRWFIPNNYFIKDIRNGTALNKILADIGSGDPAEEERARNAIEKMQSEASRSNKVAEKGRREKFVTLMRKKNRNKMEINKLNIKIQNEKERIKVAEVEIEMFFRDYKEKRKILLESLKAAKEIENNMTELVMNGNSLKVYKMSPTFVPESGTVIKTFAKLSEDMFDGIFEQSDAFYSLIKTTVENSYFLDKVRLNKTLEKRIGNVNFYFQKPYTKARYKPDLYAIAEVALKIKIPGTIKAKIAEKLSQIDSENEKIVKAIRSRIVPPPPPLPPPPPPSDEIHKVKGLTFSFQAFAEDSAVYDEIDLKNKYPQKIAHDYGWRLPTRKEIEILLNNLANSDNKKIKLAFEKIYISSDAHERTSYVIVSEKYKLKTGMKEGKEFIRLLFVKGSG